MLRETLFGAFRIVLVFIPVDVLFVRPADTASLLSERIAPLLFTEPVPVRSDRLTLVPRDGFTPEFRVVPDFALTAEPVSLRPLRTVADFREASFLAETEGLEAERLSAPEVLFTRDL